ncbi:MAG: ysh1 [Syntrophaceae bacterium]|nr:MAG: ysh1 [Syntrophaceae bacterium]
MCNAGRIKHHHLRHNLWKPGASVVFVGFQAEGTPGRRIVDGVKKIRIFNEDIAVAAKVYTINGFSAHAGRDQLLAWLQNFQSKTMQVFLVHGEFSAQEHLAGLIRERFGLSVAIPEYLEEIVLKPGKPFEKIKPAAPAAPEVNLPPLWADLKTKLDEAGRNFSTLSAEQQSEMAELLRQAAASMEKIKKSDE